jgi:hypothetical protein
VKPKVEPPKPIQIKRSSAAFDDSQNIEIERLKTTLVILQQKLKLKEDDESH